MGAYRLEMRKINKTFQSMQALTDADFTVKAGEAHGLLGINGAGKSTLIKILSGVYSKDSGQIFIDGEEVLIETVQDAIDYGVATVYQHPHLVYSFPGYENIFLGSESPGNSLLGKVDRDDLKKRAIALAEEYNIEMDLLKLVGDMKPVEREMISILSALSKKSRILILDEPTSILTEKEKGTLFNLVRELKKKGVSVIFVTHRLDEINEICEAISVFRDGKHVASLRVGEGLDAAYIAELMLGKKMETLYPPKHCNPHAEPVLDIRNLCLNRRFENINLTASKGEILGIFGLVGSGIDELSKVIFGAVKRTSGDIYLNGKPVKFSSPKEAIRNKLFLIPGDRHSEGYIGDQSTASNLVLSKMSKVCYGFLQLVNPKLRKKDAQELIARLAIATPSERKNVAELSGGNQQKVVVGKGLYTEADIYIFCEPTIGVDVGAKYSIYEIMRELCKNAVVILISSDIEEVHGMADRVIVLNQGKISLEAKGQDFTLNSMLVHAVSMV